MKMPAITVEETSKTFEPYKMPGNRAFEMRLWILLLALCNLPLLGGNIAGNLILSPSAVSAGEWWRLFTFPFVHVGWYHLVLDASAFLLLWKGLEENRLLVRVGYLIGCWAGSLLLPWFFAPEIDALGLCGLSGIAHGLLAITALEMQRRKSLQTIGKVLLLCLVVKVVFEIVSGAGALSVFHLGEVGIPIPTAHAGGLLGAMVAFAVIETLRVMRKERKRK